MKSVVLMLILLGLSSNLLAADPFLDLVQKHLNAVFSDTVNEGNTSAKVMTKDGQPQIKCSQPVYTKGRKIVFCTVEIETIYEEGARHGRTTCTSLGFVVGKTGKIDSRYSEASFQKCMDEVSSKSYD